MAIVFFFGTFGYALIKRIEWLVNAYFVFMLVVGLAALYAAIYNMYNPSK